MTRQHRVVGLAQSGSELFGHVHGAMLASRTANGDGHVTPVRLQVVRNPAGQETLDVIKHGRESLLGVEEGLHLGVEARKTSQLHRPVRVRQAAQVEDKVGVCGNAVFEAE